MRLRLSFVFVILALLALQSWAVKAQTQDLNCSVLPHQVPEKYRNIVQDALNDIFLQACTIHDHCYANCGLSRTLGFEFHKVLCDTALTGQILTECLALSHLVAEAGLDTSGFEDVCGDIAPEWNWNC